MLETTLKDSNKSKPKGLGYDIFDILVHFVPTDWLVQALINRYSVFIVCLMNGKVKQEIGGKHDGDFYKDLKGCLHYRCTPTEFRSIMDSVNSKLEVDAMMQETEKNECKGQST